MAMDRMLAAGFLFTVACNSHDGSGEDDVIHDTDSLVGTSLVLTPTAVIDDDHTTVVYVTWSTPEAMSGWVEFGLDGALDKKSPAVTASDHGHQMLGLKAGRAYTWRAVVDDGGELVASEPQTLDIPPVPPEFPTFELITIDPSADMTNAFVSVAGAAAPGAGSEDPDALFYVGFLDADGDFVWYHALPQGRGTSALDISLDRQSVWWLEVDNFREEVDGTIIRMALDGTILSETFASSAHHAAVELSGGRFAHLGRRFVPYEDKTLMIDRVLIETEGDPTGAQTLEVYDYYSDWWGDDVAYFWLPFGDGLGSLYGYDNVVDLTHSNSIAWIESEDALYPFVRIMDTLLRIDIGAASLDWEMSGLYSDFTLPSGDPVYESATKSNLWSWGHYSQIWPGGLTMFDNGSNYDPHVSSIIEVAYDEMDMTAHEVFRYYDPDGGFTNSLGDVWKLESGHYLASWMSLSKLTEVTPAGELIWEVDPQNETAVRRIRPVTDLYTFTPLAASLP